MSELKGSGALASLLASRLRDVPDFPSPGVTFKDITPLLADGAAFGQVIDALASTHGADLDVVAGVEARGFIIGAALAHRLGCGFIPIRKAGKLPGAVTSRTYELEYGTATIELQQDAFAPGTRVLVVDDVLATGGTAAAACALIEDAGGIVNAFAALIELSFLPGRAALQTRRVDCLLTV